MAPELEPKVMQAVEALGYRATVGDVAAQAGLRIPLAEQGLLTLASEVGGQMQVAETGDIAYTFPRNFRTVLFQKYWQLRLKRGLGKAWKILFYLIRLSFGVALILSIGILAIALILAALAAMAAASKDDDNDSINLGGFFYFIGELIESAFRLIFYADWLGWGGSSSGHSGGYTTQKRTGQRQTESAATAQASKSNTDLNFLEAIFSFLFGDGNPNADLEDRRWSAIAQVIRQNQGAVFAEQILPFLDQPELDRAKAEPDDAMLPVLARFQGQPQVSPEGELIYQFPELQVSVSDAPVARNSAFLQEQAWRFSQATTGQLWGAGLLGGLNAVLAVIVGLMLPDLVGSGMGFLSFVGQIYPLLLIYGLGFLLVPLVRWQVVKWRDRRVQHRNRRRQLLAQQLKAAHLQSKCAYAEQFAAQRQLNAEDSVYTTQSDLISQEIDQQSRLDSDWQQRLQSGY